MRTTDKRKGNRVQLARGIPAQMMAIDGTSRRGRVMDDASDSGARPTVSQPVEGLNIRVFFLLLSSTGLACRRCELAWSTATS